MLTASISNNNLIIYSNSVTGVNTNFLFVFNNNIFKSISTYSFSSNTINLTLTTPVTPNGATKINLYNGGITTSGSTISTTVIIASNSTVFVDSVAPSLIEMMEQGNYNFTSFVFSNFISGISTQANFPTASLTVKRHAPIGAITINEGFLGPMRVHRFAALSSTMFGVSSSITFNTYKYFAFDYNSYGDQVVNTISFSITPNTPFLTNSKAYVTINEDYFSAPSPLIVGISSIIDFSGLSTTFATFQFSPGVTINQGKYWIVFTPTVDATFGLNRQLSLNSAINNYYTTTTLESVDGLQFSATPTNGVAFQVTTTRGVPLATIDAIYNQADQPQILNVTYGDESNLNVYTPLAIAPNSHYIQKTFLDTISPVYAVETLVDSSGQNQYSVQGLFGTSIQTYYSMIANLLTTNIVRFVFNAPENVSTLKLNSMGDYYTKSNLGTVLISSSDFLGISTIEVSTSSNFPSNNTLVINPPNQPQQYLANISYDFGGLGRKFTNFQSNIGSSIRYIYGTTISGIFNYLLISDITIYAFNGTILTNIFSLTNSIFTSSTIGATGIVVTDSTGKVYVISGGIVTLLSTQVASVPTSSITQFSSTYLGVSTINDASSVQNRKRIYQLFNNSITHLSWSTQIPEPEITVLYSTSFGLIIGSYDQVNLIGKVYVYYNQVLTQIYETYLRPDVILFSTYTNNLYVGFQGSQILFANYSTSLGAFTDTGINVAGTLIYQMSATNTTGKIIVNTDISSYIFDETSLVTTFVTLPGYATSDQQGLAVFVQSLDLGIKNYQSTFINESFSSVNFDVLANGFTSTFIYNAQGYIVFNNISAGYTTSFFVQYPTNSTINSISFNGQPISLSNNSFTQSFSPSIPQLFSMQVTGMGVTGIGTIAIYNGLSSSAPIVGIASFVAQKTINWYFKTGGKLDIFALADGSIRTADISALASNQYNVYARFTDINGVRSNDSDIATDSIYNQLQQQINNQALPSGRIVEINSGTSALAQYVPPEGSNNFIYGGSRIVRATGVFESDPYFASDVTTWNQIQVLAQIPGYNQISGIGTGAEYGTSVTMYVKTAYSLSDLTAAIYVNSYQLSTINNGNDYLGAVVSILANIASLSGPWIQFKLVLVSASQGVTPTGVSLLLTYNGAGKSVFVTKTFNTASQSTITPPPQIRRGILTANFVANGGVVEFGYTTNTSDGNPANYTSITPNKIFNLATPSSQIKFGVILKTATSNPCFFDEFAVQLDTGPNDIYFMPPQPAFEIQPYTSVLGVGTTHGYQFINKSVGIVSSYNWNFGTSYPVGILTYIPPNEDPVAGPAANRQNPIVVFSSNGPFTVGLMITGFVENNVIFNSEFYTKSFIAT